MYDLQSMYNQPEDEETMRRRMAMGFGGGINPAAGGGGTGMGFGGGINPSYITDPTRPPQGTGVPGVPNHQPGMQVHEDRPMSEFDTYRSDLKDLYHPLVQGRTQYEIGSPERQNYRNYLQSQMATFHDLYGNKKNTDYAMPTIQAYNPNTAYNRFIPNFLQRFRGQTNRTF